MVGGWWRVVAGTFAVCVMCGCEQLQNWFQDPPATKPKVVVPQVVAVPAPPEPKVDRATIDAIEKRDAGIGVVHCVFGGRPGQCTDEMLTTLADVPPELFSSTALDVSTSHVTDAGLRQVAKMSRIESLNASHLQFTEAALSGLRNLPRFRKLTLTMARFPGQATLAAIGQLPQLQELWLDSTLIVDTDLAGLRDMPNLRELHLDATRLTDLAFQHLATLPRLELLTISKTSITSRGMKELCVPNSRLRLLDVHETFVGQNGFAMLDGFAELEELDASQAQVTDQSLRGWKSPPNLRRLNLAANPFSNVSLPGILNSPNLEELNLQKVAGVSDPGLNFIVKKTSLRFVQLDQTGVTLQSDQQLKQMMRDTKVGIAGTIY